MKNSMRMLRDEDEAELLGLDGDAGAEAARRAIKAIAERHGVEWESWPTWPCSVGDVLTMAVSQNDSPSYLPIIQFAFGPFCRELHDVGTLRTMFKSFFDAVGMLLGFNATPGGDGRSVRRIQDCFAAFLLAAGTEGRAHAFASLAAAFPVGANDWLDHAWRKTVRGVEGQQIFDALTTLGAEGTGRPPL